jgi:hypothetical protein
MKASDLFGVVVRTFGVSSVIYGVWYLLYGILEGVGLIPENQLGEIKMYFASGVAFFIVGLLMLRCANWFVRFSYPN